MSNITWHETSIGLEDYRRKNGHHSGVVWLTGLSGSGKSSIVNQLNEKLFAEGFQSYVLDGDNIRHGLNADLGFSESDRTENIRRIGEVAKLFAQSGTIVLTAFISPYQADRDRIKETLPDGDFLEIHVDCPLEECEARDPKGLYKKARKGEIKGFTGVDAPYERPVQPALVLNTQRTSVKEAAEQVYKLLLSEKWFHKGE